MSSSTIDLKELDTLSPDLFNPIDRHFADFMQRLSGRQSEALITAARLVSNFTGKGNICVNIPLVAGKSVFGILGEENENTRDFILYDEDEWIKELKDSSVVGRPDEFRPMILDDRKRLYLYRYWDYERKLAENIKARINYQTNNIDIERLKKGVDRLFKTNDDSEQRIASIGAVLSGFCVISGGPGTGKTTTVIRILTLLIEQAESAGALPVKIALAAPTGKAAARLAESLKNAKPAIEWDSPAPGNMPSESFTIHRLLGPISGSPYFRHNAENQLNYDVVVVDESSMADLALMSKLFQAVPVSSRLILLGDRDQLSSVEAGAVLGDICDTGRQHPYTMKFAGRLKNTFPRDFAGITYSHDSPPVADSIMLLNKSYRFGYDSGIGVLSRSIKDGEAAEAIMLLHSGNYTDISLIKMTAVMEIKRYLSGLILNGYSRYLKAGSVEGALHLFSNFTILCALRKGPLGVEAINTFVEEILSENGLISRDSPWYNGRPVMINRNDYELRLFNGDTGIIYTDSEDGKAYFYSPSRDGNARKILPLKLPDHETVFAMTVHKSQGSEFDNVLLLLPDRISPVLTRELLYTAVTRARKRVEIFGSENILRHMINNPTSRMSGLRDALWEKI